MFLQHVIDIKIIGEVFYTLLHRNSLKPGVNVPLTAPAIQTSCRPSA